MIDYMTITEVCERLVTSKPTLRKMRRAGELPPHYKRPPYSVVWNREDIEAFAGLSRRNMTEYAKLNRP